METAVPLLHITEGRNVDCPFLNSLEAVSYGFPVPLWNNGTRFPARYRTRKCKLVRVWNGAAGLLSANFASRISGRRNALIVWRTLWRKDDAFRDYGSLY